MPFGCLAQRTCMHGPSRARTRAGSYRCAFTATVQTQSAARGHAPGVHWQGEQALAALAAADVVPRATLELVLETAQPPSARAAPLHHTMEQNPPRLPPRPSPWVLPPDSHGSKNKHVLGEDPDTDPWFPQPGLCRGRTAFSGAAWPPPSLASWPELSVTAVPKPGPVQGELL